MNKVHNRKRVLTVALFVIFTVLYVHARPARPSVRTMTQPDGTSFTLISYGDEFHKVCRTSDGHAVILDKDGWWCYEVLDAEGRRCSSGFPAGSKAPAEILSESRSLVPEGPSDRRLRFDRLQTRDEPIIKKLRDATTKAGGTTITKHGIVLLAAFKDVPFSYTKEDFARMLTEQGYDRSGATGCAKDYFESQFGEGFEFNFDVADIVTMSHKRSYYGDNDSDGYDIAPEEMVIEACKLSDSNVDFSLYDQDGDGEVDNVFVFFAGEDEADTDLEECIWAHAWYIKDGAGIDLFLDGVRVNRYACASELMPTSTGSLTITGIGTFCHEYSHTLGLMDYYDTDYEESGGMSGALWNATALMDGGNSNNNGNTPPYFNAIDREVMGISEPVVISGNGTFTMAPVGKGGKTYRLDTDNPDEYYLLECREASGWDKYIGGNGMLVYHIDKSERASGYSDAYGKNLTARQRWNIYNEINASPSHQCADLIEADGRNDSFSDFQAYGSTLGKGISGIFFPTSNVTSIPSTRLIYWSDATHQISISNITKSNGNISFYVSGFAGEVPPVAVFGSRYIFQNAAIIQFTSDREGYQAEATVSYGKTNGEKESVLVKPYSPGKYSVTLEGLTPSTNYDVTVSFTMESGTGKENSISFLTSRLQGGSYPYVSFKGSERNSNGSFKPESGLPLKVWNATDAAVIKWYFDEKEVFPSGDGFFTPGRNGELRAVIIWEDGSEDIILKEIIIEESDAE
ncbi:MAG: M6 family metalloprotease domain-containing protein [Candidatus Cryptobacteroides sp.]